jgi:hypothetical protein
VCPEKSGSRLPGIVLEEQFLIDQAGHICQQRRPTVLSHIERPFSTVWQMLTFTRCATSDADQARSAIWNLDFVSVAMSTFESAIALLLQFHNAESEPVLAFPRTGVWEARNNMWECSPGGLF